MKVFFTEQVEADVISMVRILVENGYISTYSFAIQYVDDMVSYILEHIDTAPAKKAPSIFDKYGDNLHYIIYKKSQHTTWYILFQKYLDHYTIVYITNNQYEGKFFNCDKD